MTTPDIEPPKRWRHALSVTIIRGHQLVKRSRFLSGVATRVNRFLAESPSSPVRLVLASLRARLVGEMSARDVLGVLDALEAEGLRCSLAGGWGVDALIGHQTRRHDDVDIILYEYEDSEPRARRVLADLGYRHVQNLVTGIWMSPGCLVEDDARHRVDLLGVDWTRLDIALGQRVGQAGESTVTERLVHEVFSQGLLEGRVVPCLSLIVQLVFHSSFELRHHHERDFAALRAQMEHGTSTAGPGST